VERRFIDADGFDATADVEKRGLEDDVQDSQMLDKRTYGHPLVYKGGLKKFPILRVKYPVYRGHH
jgi:hypothetical protein